MGCEFLEKLKFKWVSDGKWEPWSSDCSTESAEDARTADRFASRMPNLRRWAVVSLPSNAFS